MKVEKIDQSLEDRMQSQMVIAPGWSPPQEYDLGDPTDRRILERQFDQGEVSGVVDGVQHIASELFEISYPSDKDDVELKQEFIKEVNSKKLEYGKWYYFPWSGELIRYPDKDAHRDLRTARNRELITREEQLQLYASTIAIFGLSVGSNIVEKLVTSGIGGKIILADMDVIEPTNLNRINGDFTDIGSKKVDYIARKISKIDPYIEQIHYKEGISEVSLEEVAEVHKPDIMFDAVDDLTIKALIRVIGSKNKIAVMMATDVGDKSLFDVERYDIDGKTRPFLGRIPKRQLEQIAQGNIDPSEGQKILIKLVGLRHITPRLLQSAMQIGNTLSGVPQLGVTASMGGSLAAVAAREMLLGREMESGRYHYSPKKVLKLKSPSSLNDGFKVFRTFVKNK